MASVSSKALFGIGVAMTVAAISSIFVVMVAAQDPTTGQGGFDNNNDITSQQDDAASNATTTTTTIDREQVTDTIIIPEGAAARQVEQYYIPNPAQVQSGSEVTWQNQDVAPHTATADDGSFDTGIIGASSSGSVVVQGEGEIPYYCTLHPFMTATLHVISEGGQQASQNVQQQGRQVNAIPEQNVTKQNQTRVAEQQPQTKPQSLDEALQQAGTLLIQAGNILRQVESNQSVIVDQNTSKSSQNTSLITNATRAFDN